MLDHRLFIDDAQNTLQRLARRGPQAEATAAIQDAVDLRRQTIAHLESLRQALNQASSKLGQQAQRGDTEALAQARAGLRELKDSIKTAEQALAEVEAGLEATLLTVPNLPDEDVPVGRSEADNVVEHTWGTPPRFDFEAKPHWDLVQQLGIVDFEQASRISGPRFAVYRGAGARLERALASLMLDLARNHGHMEIAPPLLVRPHSMENSGQYPKFRGEAFETEGGEHALIPTAEVPLVNMHAGDIVDADRLPLRYTAYTPCFRREAGAAGKDTRGLIRMHQFQKVELVALTTAEDSRAELLRIRRQASHILELLGLPYRVVSLCTGDLGFGATQTYDLEVWLPGQNTYREISSCSNCGDFQARRAKIRYRPAATDSKRAKPRLVHTLNGSALAVGRTLVAVLENGQQADGSIRVPDALVPYFGATHIASADS